MLAAALNRPHQKSPRKKVQRSVPQVCHNNQRIVSDPQTMDRLSATSETELALPIPRTAVIRKIAGHRHLGLRRFTATNPEALTTQAVRRANENDLWIAAMVGDQVSSPGISPVGSQERGRGIRQPTNSIIVARPEKIRSMAAARKSRRTLSSRAGELNASQENKVPRCAHLVTATEFVAERIPGCCRACRPRDYRFMVKLENREETRSLSRIGKNQGSPMHDPHNERATQRKQHQEEIDQSLATKEQMLQQAKASYDAAKEAYDKAEQHDHERTARRAANNQGSTARLSR
jgi:hypothetical protein